MRFKQHYSLYPRKKKDGSIIWYYRTYDESGKRTPGTSTGLSSKAKARAFCEDLYSTGLLYTSPKANVLMKVYIKDFFGPNSSYIKNKIAEGTESNPILSENTIKSYNSLFNNHIYDFFKDIKIKDFNFSLIKKYRENLITKNISRKTINATITVLRVIANELMQNEIIEDNPVAKLKPLKIDEESKVGSFTKIEAKMLLWADYKKEEYKLLCIVLCLTGLRVSEALALNKDNIYPGYIDVKIQKSITTKKYKQIKNKTPRIVPIIPELYDLLMNSLRPDGTIFKYSYTSYYCHIVQMIDFLGFEERRIKDNLHIHSWRHFYNTYLLAENIAPSKVDAIIGHKDKERKMQAIYTNFDITHFSDVQDANKKLWNYMFN